MKAYELFADPEWDGKPPGSEEEQDTPQKIKIKLADGKERAIQHMMATTVWCADGRPMSAAQFVERPFGELPSLLKDEVELRKIWSRPDTRKPLLEGLSEKGFGASQLGEIKSLIDAENSDIFDVLAYVAFTHTPKTRQERAEAGKERIAGEYDDKLRAFLDFVLAEYVAQGEDKLAQEKLSELIGLKYGTAAEAAKKLGGVATIRDAFIGFQHHLYEV